MQKLLKIFLIFLLTAIPLNTEAYQDYIITTDGKLTDIAVQNNEIIDVYPMITIMNDKNTLIVHPLKEGNSMFRVVKNKKEKIYFSVKVETENTTISDVEGFNIYSIDEPPNMYEYELDEPPMLKGVESN